MMIINLLQTISCMSRKAHMVDIRVVLSAKTRNIHYDFYTFKQGFKILMFKSKTVLKKH